MCRYKIVVEITTRRPLHWYSDLLKKMAIAISPLVADGEVIVYDCTERLRIDV